VRQHRDRRIWGALMSRSDVTCSPESGLESLRHPRFGYSG
jgi:hypothetical protein